MGTHFEIEKRYTDEAQNWLFCALGLGGDPGL
jgi:hypothetical protein